MIFRHAEDALAIRCHGDARDSPSVRSQHRLQGGSKRRATRSVAAQPGGARGFVPCCFNPRVHQLEKLRPRLVPWPSRLLRIGGIAPNVVVTRTRRIMPVARVPKALEQEM